MAAQRISEAELNQLEEIILGKIQQRTPQRTNEDKYIIKALKHNDLNNTGWCSFDQFRRALAPFTAGIHDMDMHAVFSRYTNENEDMLHYKTFAVEFVNGTRRVESNDRFQDGGSAEPELWETVEDTLMRVKVFLYSHGPRKIVALASAFRDADFQNARAIDFEAFHAVMTDFFAGSECPLQNEHLEQIFQVFQQPYGPSQIAYDEFFLALKEEPGPERRACIRAAFRRLDEHSESLVDVNNMLKNFNATRHPQVADGTRQPQEVTEEFEETIRDLVAFRRGQRSYPTNLIAWEEFEDYYKFIGGCYETDDLFCTTLTRVWDLDKQSHRASDHRAAHAAPAAGVAAKARAGLHHWQEDTLMHNDHRSAEDAVNLDDCFARARAQVAKQGLRKAIDVVNNFFSVDDDVDDLIDAHEFTRACQQSKLSFSGKEQTKIFQDMGMNVTKKGKGNGKGTTERVIRVPDFLARLHGPMSRAREDVVAQAFESLGGDPRSEESAISPAVLKDNFRSDQHPDVATGKRDANMLHTEFLDTFSLFAHARGGCQNGMVTFSDFISYYEVVSSIIDNDAFFCLLVRRCWSLASTFCGGGEDAPLLNDRQASLNSPRQDSPMANPRPAKHSGPSAYVTAGSHVEQQHRRFLRKEVPDYPEPNGEGSRPMTAPVAGFSPITKSSVVFDEVDNSSELGRVIAHLRECVGKRSLRGWRMLLERFAQYDNRGNNGIMRNDFERMHKTLGLGLTPDERETLFKGLAAGRKDGAMDSAKCVRLLKGRLSEERQGLVDALFEDLSQGRDRVTASDLVRHFSPSNSPGCMFWKKPASQVQQEFEDAVSYFSAPTGAMDKSSFDDFFAIVSAVNPSNDEFHLMATAAFGLPQ